MNYLPIDALVGGLLMTSMMSDCMKLTSYYADMNCIMHAWIVLHQPRIVLIYMRLSMGKGAFHAKC